MIRMTLIAAALSVATPALAEISKEEGCGYQAQVVAAIQKARLDRVREKHVKRTLLAETPPWPENYNATIPLITPWVYELKMSDVRNNDLSKIWLDACIAQ